MRVLGVFAGLVMFVTLALCKAAGRADRSMGEWSR
jgi:hypothetical protein